MTTQLQYETLLSEIQEIKKHMPNGELTTMARDMKDMKEDISDLKYTLLNPENGVIVKTNKNTDFITVNQDRIDKVDELVAWKDTVTKVLWILFTALVAVVLKLITMT